MPISFLDSMDSIIYIFVTYLHQDINRVSSILQERNISLKESISLKEMLHFKVPLLNLLGFLIEFNELNDWAPNVPMCNKFMHPFSECFKMWSPYWIASSWNWKINRIQDILASFAIFWSFGLRLHDVQWTSLFIGHWKTSKHWRSTQRKMYQRLVTSF